MPQFHPTEKERILQQLIDHGRALFVRQGLKKTSLEQLTQAIGVAKSTFYAFYNSKEELYLQLLELEAIAMEKQVWEEVAKAADTRDALKAYLNAMVNELERNPLTKRLIEQPEEMEMISRKVTPEFVQRKLERNVKPLIEYIMEQQKQGLMLDADPAVISGVLRASMLLVVHRKDFDEDIFPQIREILFHAVAGTLAK